MPPPLDDLTPPHSRRLSSKPWTLWLGPGSPGSIAEALGGLDQLADGGRLFLGLEDIAELLKADIGSGRLVVAASSVPPEDLGILKRFLAHDPGRELVVLSAVADAESFLVLPRTRVFPLALAPRLMGWLASLPEGLPVKEPTGPGERADRLALSWQILRERLADRHDLAPLLGRLEAELARSAPANNSSSDELVDLGALAEELLAGISLERDRRMRFLFRPEGELSMRASRGDLELCLRHLFDLVGRCSSPDSVIRVRVTSNSGSEADPDASLDATVEFPDAPLSDLPMGAELEPETLARHFGPEVSASLRILRSTATSLGASLDSLPTRPGRRRVRLRLPRLITTAP